MSRFASTSSVSAQLKDVGGNISFLIITLTPSFGSPDRLEIGHKDSIDNFSLLATAPLEQFKGVWNEAYERMTRGHEGTY